MHTSYKTLRQITKQGSLILFVGNAAPYASETPNLIDKLTKELAEQIEDLEWQKEDLPYIAQVYEEAFGREKLIKTVQQHIHSDDNFLEPIHQLTAILGSKVTAVVTTSINQRLEYAFEENDVPIQKLLGGKNPSFALDQAKRPLFYLFIDFENLANQLCITEDDYESFLSNSNSISTTLKGFLARNTLLFIGYDPDDHYFKRLYRLLTLEIDNQSRSNYIVASTFSTAAARWCKRHQLYSINEEPTSFLQSFINQLSTKQKASTNPSSPANGQPKSQSIPERPYKLLDYYESKDSNIFYGREEDTQALGALIHAHRLILLFGASGTGKTSLLLAGAAPFLLQSEPDYEFIYVRALENPTEAIKRSVKRKLTNNVTGQDTVTEGNLVQLRSLLNRYFNETDLRELCFELSIDYENLAGSSKRDKVRELIIYCQNRERLANLLEACKRHRPNVNWPAIIEINPHVTSLQSAILPSDARLVDFLDAATQRLSQTLIIILDQFEEFFIRLSPQFRTAFIAELGSLVDASDIPVKIVISLREDWLASVSEIEARIPSVFRNRVRLLPLTRAQARRAITSPVQDLGIQYEPQLEETLLNDLLGSGGTIIMPPQLQLVCHTLFTHLPENETFISLSLYRSLGGSKGILQKYLDDELSRFKPEERIIARLAMEELVTSEGTKAVKHHLELALALKLEEDAVQSILEKLVTARLLRVIEHPEEGVAYELAHEYLIREIRVGDEAKARKQTEELLKQEVENWQRFQTLLAADKLALIGEWRELLKLLPEAQELLLRSAIQVGFDIKYWLGRVSKQEQKADILADMANSKVPVVRQRVAEILATQDESTSVSPLIQLAVYDLDFSVRKAAQKSIAQLKTASPEIIEQLYDIASGDSTTIQRQALEALTFVDFRNLPSQLRFRVATTRLRLQAAWLFETALGTPARRYTVLATVIAFLIIIIPYSVSASSYYLAIERGIFGENIGVVVRQGHPLLSLPGLGRTAITTGYGTEGIATDNLEAINQQQIWGFWLQRSPGGYSKWAHDFANVLPIEEQLTWQWYLSPEETLNELKALQPVEGEDTCASCGQLLAEILFYHPAMEPQINDILELWQADTDAVLRVQAASAIGHMLLLDSELATPYRITSLKTLMQDDVETVRFAASSSLGAAIYQVSSIGPNTTPNSIRESTFEWIENENIVDFLISQLSDEASLNPILASLQTIFFAHSENITSTQLRALLAKLNEVNSSTQARIINSLPIYQDIDHELIIGRLLEQLSKASDNDDPVIEESILIVIDSIIHQNVDLDYSAIFQALSNQIVEVAPENLDIIMSSLEGIAASQSDIDINIVASILIPLLSSNDSNFQNQVARSLPNMVALTSTPLSFQAVEELVELLNQAENPEFRSTIATVLIRSAPTFSQEEFDYLFAQLFVMRDPISQQWLVTILNESVKNNPDFATERLIETILSSVKEEEMSSEHPEASLLWGAAMVKPQLVTPEVIDALQISLNDKPGLLNIQAVSAWGTILSTHLAQNSLEESENIFRLHYCESPIEASEALTLTQTIFDNRLVMADSLASSLRQAVGEEGYSTHLCAIDALWNAAAYDPQLLNQNEYVTLHEASGKFQYSNTSLASDVLANLPKRQVNQQAQAYLEGIDLSNSVQAEPTVNWLGQVLLGEEEYATSELVNSLILLIRDDRNPQIQPELTSVLWNIFQANPDLLTPEHLDFLQTLLLHENDQVRIQAHFHWMNILNPNLRLILPDTTVARVSLDDEPLFDETDSKLEEIRVIENRLALFLGETQAEQIAGLLPYLVDDNLTVVSLANFVLFDALRGSPSLATPSLANNLLSLAVSSPNNRHLALSSLWQLIRFDPSLLTVDIYTHLASTITNPDDLVRSVAVQEWRATPPDLVTDEVLAQFFRTIEERDTETFSTNLDTVSYLIYQNPEKYSPLGQQIFLFSISVQESNLRSQAINLFSLYSRPVEQYFGEQEIKAIAPLLQDPYIPIRSSALNMLSRISQSEMPVALKDEINAQQLTIQLFFEYSLGNLGSYEELQAALREVNSGILDNATAILANSLTDENSAVGATAHIALWNTVSNSDTYDAFLAETLQAQLKQIAYGESPQFQSLDDSQLANSVNSQPIDRLSSLLLLLASRNPDLLTASTIDHLIVNGSKMQPSAQERTVVLLQETLLQQPNRLSPQAEAMLKANLAAENDTFAAQSAILLWAKLLGSQQPPDMELAKQLLVPMTDEADPLFQTQSVSTMRALLEMEEPTSNLFALLYETEPELIRQVTIAFTRAYIFDGVETSEIINWLGAIHPEMQNEIFSISRTQLDVNEDWDHLRRTTFLVKTLLTDNPELYSEELAALLVRRLRHVHAPVVQNVVDSLEIVFEAEFGTEEELNDLLIEALIDPLNSAGRIVMQDRLVQHALDSPSQSNYITLELLERANSNSPIVRHWTNRTLQMLELVQIVHETNSDYLEFKAAEKTLFQHIQLEFFREDSRIAFQVLQQLRTQRLQNIFEETASGDN